MYKSYEEISKSDVITLNITRETKAKYITFKALDKYNDKIKYGFFLRSGGKSTGIYSSLNVRRIGKDNKENVKENLNIIKEEMKTDVLCKASQTHSKNVLVLTSKNKEKYNVLNSPEDEYDAYITNEANIAMFVTTADCNPIIIYDPKNNAIAVVHSGWKGTVKRVYLEALYKMKQTYGTNYEDAIICVGPSIEKCCFSSEEDNFKEIFKNSWNMYDEKEFIEYEKENKKRFHIDLHYLIKKDLEKAGVKEANIHFANICTCCNEDKCFSYRKYMQKGYDDYATEATVIRLM